MFRDVFKDSERIHFEKTRTKIFISQHRESHIDQHIIYIYISGQIIIFHQSRFPWNNGISLSQLPFGVRSREVAIIWPDTYMDIITVPNKPSHRKEIKSAPTTPRKPPHLRRPGYVLHKHLGKFPCQSLDQARALFEWVFFVNGRVGDWINPFEKYASQNWNLPQFSGWK